MIRYHKGECIGVCEKKVADLRTPGDKIQKGDSIDCSIVITDASFGELYHCWFENCVQWINESANPPFDDPKRFFYNAPYTKGQVTEEQAKKFLDAFGGIIQSKVWRQMGKPVRNQICGAIDDSLLKVPTFMKLRVQIVCLFLASDPQKVFSSGNAWTQDFLPDAREADFLPIKDGQKFTVTFDGIEKLFPRTLRNDSGSERTISICYGNEKYSIRFPPYGFVRAIFGNEACDADHLVSIKGNISADNDHYAYIQKTNYDRGQATDNYKMPILLQQNALTKKGAYMGLNRFFDAAPNGCNEQFAVALTQGAVFHLSDNRLEARQPMPIRVYGAGNNWVYQYADGRIESNIQPKEGTSKEQAYAVVEYSGKILLRDKNGAWEYSGIKYEKKSDADFVRKMMERFGNAKCFEFVQTDWGHLFIDTKGAFGFRDLNGVVYNAKGEAV